MAEIRFHPAFLDEFVFERLNAGKSEKEIVDEFMANYAMRYEAYLRLRVQVAEKAGESALASVDINQLKTIFLLSIDSLGTKPERKTDNGVPLGERIFATIVDVQSKGTMGMAYFGGNIINIDCLQILNKIDIIGGSAESHFLNFFHAMFFHEMSHKLDHYLRLTSSDFDSERFAEGLAKYIMERSRKDYNSWGMSYLMDKNGVDAKKRIYGRRMAKIIGYGLSGGMIYEAVEHLYPLVKEKCNTRGILYEPGGGLEAYTSPMTEHEIRKKLS